MSQRILINYISKSGPPDLIRIIKEPTLGKASQSTLDIDKVGTEQTKAHGKRKFSSLIESEMKISEGSHLQPQVDEQVADAQKRGDELQKSLASLKKRLKEKQEKLLLQCDSQSIVAESLAFSSGSSKEDVSCKRLEESQNVSDSAQLKDLNASLGVSSVTSLRLRQKQLRQTIELNNLKNISSKQKTLLSEQKLRLNESKQLFDECSAEVERFEGLVEDGKKRLADFERRHRLLLGMLTKATKNVLDARRALREAKLHPKN